MEQEVLFPFNWNDVCGMDNHENVHLLLPTLSEIDRENNIKESIGNYQKCQCCPYGYHIDVDFVRYCESMTNGTYLKQLKQLRKNWRRQRKSMEALLHCHEAKSTQPDTTLRIKSTPDVTTPTPTSAQDALKEAIYDFEKTLQNYCPSCTSCSNHKQISPICCLTNHHDVASINTNSLALSKSRSDSTSSINSVSTLSSVADHVPQIGHSTASQQMATTMATLTDSLASQPSASSPVGSVSSSSDVIRMNKSALHSIREQMANSLCRMRELEDHVKNIPILQVKLSVLKEEKRLLMLQLKAKNCKLDQRSIGVGDDFVGDMSLEEMGQRLDRLGAVGITSPRLRRKIFNGDRTRTRSVSPESRSKILHPVDYYSLSRISDETKLKKHSEVNHKVVTRDVGVSHVQPLTKSTGTTTEFQDFCLICESREKKEVKLKKICCKCLDEKKGNGIICQQCEARKLKFKKHVGMVTDVPTEEYLLQLASELKARTINLKVNHKGVNTSAVKKVNCGCNATPSMRTSFTTPELSMKDIVTQKEVKEILMAERNSHIKSTSDVGTQFSTVIQTGTIATQTSGDETLANTIKKKDFGVTVDYKVPTLSKKVGNDSPYVTVCEKCQHSNKKSVGVGNATVRDIVCDKCVGIRKRSYGVGNSNVNENPCLKCNSMEKQITIGVGEASVSDNFCLRCDNLKTSTIGVGTGDVNLILCDTCVKQEKVSSKKVTLCEKCNKMTDSSPPPPLPSRIPRMGMSVTQDTTPKTSKAKYTGWQDTEGSNKGFINKEFHNLSPGKNNSLSDSVDLKSVPAAESESSDSSDSDSSDSPDEGSYDGIHGNIVRTCHDDEAIRKGLPGAVMFQPIHDKPRVKHKLSGEIATACQVLNQHLTKHNQVPSKALNSSLNLIQQEWFRVSSQKDSDANLVEDYLDAFEDISRQLLEKIVNLTDANGNTTMHYAVSQGNFDIVGILLDSKVVDINKQNKAGYTCIMLASLAPIRHAVDRDILLRLFQLGDINIKATQNGQTALMLAVSHGRLDIVKMLVDAGADVNIQDEDGSTALMCASEHGHIDIVRFILAHPDCDPAITDNENSTALTIALETDHKDIGVLLYAHMNIAKGGSPHSSFRAMRNRGSSHSSTPPPRTPPPPSPALSRHSTTSVP